MVIWWFVNSIYCAVGGWEVTFECVVRAGIWFYEFWFIGWLLLGIIKDTIEKIY